MNKTQFSIDRFNKDNVIKFLKENPNHKNKQAILDELQLINSIPLPPVLFLPATKQETMEAYDRFESIISAHIGAIEEINRLVN